jgi:hypothetical protein
VAIGGDRHRGDAGPAREIILAAGTPARSGIPYLVPELVLLLKAESPRPNDHSGFDGVLPLLSQQRREFLAGG